MPHRKSSKPVRKVARSSTRTSARSATRGTTRGATRPSRESGHESHRGAPLRASPPEPHPVPRVLSLPPHELYRHEKRRRADQPRAAGRDPLEEARREFKAMLEAGVGTPRGGRPRKVKPRPEGEDE
jgi:hypothetical protein